MAAIQKQFNIFHDAIKLDENDERAKLREKRDILLTDLRARLPADVPGFSDFHQGSYAMNTGTLPLDGNYDIDVGLIFSCKQDRYKDPVELKKKVRDALVRPNRTIDIRRPCVTVTYLCDAVPQYHVDFAIYVQRDDSYLDLASGKESSNAETRIWQVSDPKGLTALIRARLAAEEAEQFRRCVRYLKRWRCHKFSNGGAPLSIALTVAAYHWFVPKQDLSGNFVDLSALRYLTDAMLSNFAPAWSESALVSRLMVRLPVIPNNDLMAKLSNAQMDVFRERLTVLRDELVAAERDALPEDAANRMKKQFGNEFPIPEKNDTAKVVSAPYVSTGTSA